MGHSYFVYYTYMYDESIIHSRSLFFVWSKYIKQKLSGLSLKWPHPFGRHGLYPYGIFTVEPWPCVYFVLKCYICLTYDKDGNLEMLRKCLMFT